VAALVLDRVERLRRILSRPAVCGAWSTSPSCWRSSLPTGATDLVAPIALLVIGAVNAD